MRTRTLGTIKCPKCNQKGQLKRKLGKNNRYCFTYEVNHYLTGHHRKYLSSCYLGTEKNIFENLNLKRGM